MIFVKNNAKIDDVTINHEAIHSKQFIELMILFAVVTVFIRWWLPLFAPLFFYVWYVAEWLVRTIQYRNFDKAYKNISFEREAYANEGDASYLKGRGWFNFLKYL